MKRSFSHAFLFLLAFACLASPAWARSDATTGYIEIQRAFLREEFQDVHRLAKSFLRSTPNAPERARVQIWMALSLDKLQKSGEALMQLDDLEGRLNPRDPSLAESLYWKGEINRRALKMLEARLAYRRLMDEFPNSIWALRAQLGLGMVLLHEQSYDDAVKHFQAVAERFHGTRAGDDARFFQAVCSIQLGKPKDAIGILQPVLETAKDPSSRSRAGFYLGEAFTKLERYGEALDAYRAAVKAEESSEWSRLAQFGIGWAAYRKGDCSTSVEALENYLTPPGGTHRTEALIAQGECLSQLGRPEEAQSRFERALAKEAKEPLSLENGLAIADAYRRQGLYDKAKDVFTQLLKAHTGADAQDRIQLQRSRNAFEAGGSDEAMKYLRAILNRAGSQVRPAALNLSGDIAFSGGKWDEAKQVFNEAAQGGESLDALYATYQLGRIALQQDQIDAALPFFEKVAGGKDQRLADDARLARALAHLTRKEPKLAYAQLSELRQQRPDSTAAARAAYYLAVLAVEDGKTQAAVGLCQEASKKAAGTDEGTDALLLLAEIRASESSAGNAQAWLKGLFAEESRPASQRSKIAKRLGDFARTEERYAEAIEWYDNAEQLWPAVAAETLYRSGSCFEEVGDFEVALARYRAIHGEPWRVRGQLAAAKILEREHRMDEAKDVYRDLAKSSAPEAKMARERLDMLEHPLRKGVGGGT